MRIKCKNCTAGEHDSVRAVRECYGAPATAGPEPHAESGAERTEPQAHPGRKEGGWGTQVSEPRVTHPCKMPNDVPAGYYAIPSRTGNNDLDFFKVDKPDKGRWEGWTFVKRLIGGHAPLKVRPGEQAAILADILIAGPDKATALYGQEIGQCGKCNRSLTDERSRALGIGPECWRQGHGQGH